MREKCISEVEAMGHDHVEETMDMSIQWRT
jgi:hypothetical protein